MILLVIFGVVFVVFGTLTHVPVAGGILGAVAAGIYWWRDVKRRPKVRCRACGGSGDSLSRIQIPGLRRPAGPCGACGGKKGVPRPALRIVDGAERRKILGEISKAKDAIKR